MRYVVQPGDSLWRIGQKVCGDGLAWRAIARDNRLADPDLLMVGQVLSIDDAMRQGLPNRTAVGESSGLTGPPRGAGRSDSVATAGGPQRVALVPAASYVFVLADEIDPLRGKVVRRVLVNPAMAAEASRNLGRPLSLFPNPERFGFHASGPDAPITMGRHATGMKPSPYQSASTKLLGARRFVGSSFWIDVDAARAAGATIHTTEEIIADLDRIAGKAATSAERLRVEGYKAIVLADREVLLKGSIPASAIKGGASMALTRGLQGVQVIGFTMSAVNLAHATDKSVRMGSAKPIGAEAVRQVGGWAMAWAGVKLGAAGGAMLGIESGPGAIATGAIGSVVGGVAGYFGFDWVADHIDEN